MAVGELAFGILALAVGVLALYLLYGAFHRAFQRVGFTPAEAGVILVGTFVGSAWDVPIWPTPVGAGWWLAVNVGGAVVPVVVSFWLLRRIPSMGLPALAGATVVALVAYLVTRATPEGIVAPAALALAVPATAALFSLTAHWREEDHAAPLAYVVGTLGALVGADALRLHEFLAQPPPADAFPLASIGGAAVFDMVFLTGMIAVGLDALVFREKRRMVHHAELPYAEAEVFTVGTSAERMASWDVPRPPKAQTVHGERLARARGESVREVVERTPDRPRAARPRPATVAETERAGTPPAVLADDRLPRNAPPSGEDRLARHRAWEEQMRRRRGG